MYFYSLFYWLYSRQSIIFSVYQLKSQSCIHQNLCSNYHILFTVESDSYRLFLLYWKITYRSFFSHHYFAENWSIIKYNTIFLLPQLQKNFTIQVQIHKFCWSLTFRLCQILETYSFQDLNVTNLKIYILQLCWRYWYDFH